MTHLQNATPEHKALVEMLRDNPTIPTDTRAAAEAIEALDVELEDARIESAIRKARADAAEERAEALLAELRAKETEIETLAARLDAQGSELADYAKTVQELRRRKP